MNKTRIYLVVGLLFACDSSGVEWHPTKKPQPRYHGLEHTYAWYPHYQKAARLLRTKEEGNIIRAQRTIKIHKLKGYMHGEYGSLWDVVTTVEKELPESIKGSDSWRYIYKKMKDTKPIEPEKAAESGWTYSHDYIAKLLKSHDPKKIIKAEDDVIYRYTCEPIYHQMGLVKGPGGLSLLDIAHQVSEDSALKKVIKYSKWDEMIEALEAPTQVNWTPDHQHVANLLSSLDPQKIAQAENFVIQKYKKEKSSDNGYKQMINVKGTGDFEGMTLGNITDVIENEVFLSEDPKLRESLSKVIKDPKWHEMIKALKAPTQIYWTRDHQHVAHLLSSLDPEKIAQAEDFVIQKYHKEAASEKGYERMIDGKIEGRGLEYFIEAIKDKASSSKRFQAT